MRIIIKLILLPVTITLSIIVLICRILCQLSTMLLCCLSFIIFTIGLATMVLLQEPTEGLKVLGLALIISPIGIPLIATFLIELIHVFNESLKTI